MDKIPMLFSDKACTFRHKDSSGEWTTSRKGLTDVPASWVHMTYRSTISVSTVEEDEFYENREVGPVGDTWTCTGENIRLQPSHGRKTPDEELKDWGFTGEAIDNLVRVTYLPDLNVLRIVNDKVEVTDLPFFEDMLVINGGFYGDIEVQSPGWKL